MIEKNEMVRSNAMKKKQPGRMSSNDGGDNGQLLIKSLSECDSECVSEELGSEVDSEYPDDIAHVIDCMVTVKGEALADVMAGIRDALDKLNKILYNKL